MTIVYKLTDQHMRTHGGFEWKIGEERTADGYGGLCGPGWLHGYTDPLLAVLLNPIHAAIENPRLFRAEAEIEKDDHGLKFGTRKMRLTEELLMPAVTTEQRVRFAILCAREVFRNSEFLAWADRWLAGTDRTERAAARAAESAARSVAASAASAARSAASAARSAAWSAARSTMESAAESVAESVAESAAESAASAAESAASAAWSAASAAWSAALDLVGLAQRAMRTP